MIAALSLIIALVAVIVLVLHTSGSDEAADIAQLVSILLAIPALVVPLILWWWRSRRPASPVSADLAKAKDVLTGLVIEQWRTEALVRSLDDPEPIPVHWRLTDRPELMDHPKLIASGRMSFTGRGDRPSGLAERFRRLRRRRLVITGGPGSGKTTLAIQLLLELAGSRIDDEPVPALFPVALWDIDRYPRLHDWLLVQLEQDYPALKAVELGEGAAAALARRGHILPVLDGFDELPAAGRARVITSLNASLGDRDQLILTSRTEELATAVAEAGDVLTAAAVVAPSPITPAADETYLRTCLPPAPRHDWAPVWAALRNASRPGLTALARTALGLWLIRTVYIASAADPTPLTGPLADRPETLRAHLLDHLIAATIRSRPPSTDPAEHFRPRTAWEPERARHYLAYLAHVLRSNRSYDLAWWQLPQLTIPPAGQRRIGRRVKLTAGLAVGLTMGLAFGIPVGAAAGLTGGLAVGFWLTARLALEGRSRLAAGLVTGVVFVLPVGLGVGLAVELPVGLLGGLPIGVVVGLVGGFAVRLAPEGRVRLAAGITTGFVFLVTLPVVGGAAGGSTGAITGGLAYWFAPDVVRWFDETPGYASFRLSGRMSALARRLRGALAFILLSPLAIMLAVTIADEVIDGPVDPAWRGLAGFLFAVALLTWAGVGLGMSAKAVIEWTEQPASSATALSPPAMWKSDRALTLLRTSSVAVAGGLVFGLLEGLLFGLHDGLTSGLPAGLVIGLAFGLRLGKHHAWLAAKLAHWRLARRAETPRDLMAFLDDAHRLGLLRTVGSVYQFRHAELQDHLAAAYEAPR